MDYKKRFFSQSYKNALMDYVYMCENSESHAWDRVILTASNEQQAEAYRLQIEARQKQGRLPYNTSFEVVADYKDQRVGSGGATLNVLRKLVSDYGVEKLLSEKILLINSGGDSKRIPQYSACGKVFAPVLRTLESEYVSTIFDELLIASIDIYNRVGRGILILPSDTELLFDSSQLDLLSCEAAGLSMKAPVSEGIEHGVFLSGHEKSDHRNYNISKFLHKLPEEILRDQGAVDIHNEVDIDTGCIWIGTTIVEALIELFYKNNSIDEVLFEKFVNPKVCLNFYSDFVYPLAENGTFEEYLKQSPENGFSEQLTQARTTIWNRLNKFQISLIRLMPANYIHFGMTHEMFELWTKEIDKFDYLGWTRRINTNAKSGSVVRSIIDSNVYIPKNVYIEDSKVLKKCEIGEGTVLSNVDIEADVRIPENIVLSGLKLKNGKYVYRIYGKEDNPKSSANGTFLHRTLNDLMKESACVPSDLWDEETPFIWNANIYSECEDSNEALKASLNLYKIIEGTASPEEISCWKHSNRISLKNSFLNADVEWMVHRQNNLREKIIIEQFISGITEGKPMLQLVDCLLDHINLKKYSNLERERNIDEITNRIQNAIFPVNMRLALACAHICKELNMNENNYSYSFFEDMAYEIVKDTISEATRKKHFVSLKKDNPKKTRVEIDLPVRVNFCGSPSDAAPYCLEYGGTMLDAAILLKNQKPIKVIAEIMDKGYILESIDQSCELKTYDKNEIMNCDNPFDPFALHKAVLVATGIMDFYDNGIKLSTNVDVPKGSGLGTSSIIAAAAVKAVNELFDLDTSDQTIYALVFLVEQLMTTGGGWQDQDGGLTAGVKYFTSRPGLYQDIYVEHLKLEKNIQKELDERFVLIFSGQRRLARNVLREELNQCIRCDEKALKTIDLIQDYCSIMRQKLLKGDVTSFAKYISKQFELVKSLDKGASNACIEYIFDVCEDLIDGKSICGAGGGGFLMVILKKGVKKNELKQRLDQVFVDCGVEVWDSSLYWEE